MPSRSRPSPQRTIVLGLNRHRRRQCLRARGSCQEGEALRHPRRRVACAIERFGHHSPCGVTCQFRADVRPFGPHRSPMLNHLPALRMRWPTHREQSLVWVDYGRRKVEHGMSARRFAGRICRDQAKPAWSEGRRCEPTTPLRRSSGRRPAGTRLPWCTLAAVRLASRVGRSRR
jgi:hypothetical protein